MKQTTPTIDCIWDGKALLGEGPLYSPKSHSLYWVDINGCRFYQMDLETNKIQTYKTPSPIGWIHERQNGGIICGLKTGFAFYNTVNSEITPLFNPEEASPNIRLNDAKVDSRGYIWAGSMDETECDASGSLYRLAPDLSCEKMDDGYVISNGPALSPDEKTLYHTCSTARKIFAFDLNGEGLISNKRLHIQFEEKDGYPDGMTCDNEGGLWVAHWGGWRISRFQSNGQLDFEIEMPVSQPTSICFGGANLDEIYVTSASIELTEEELSKQPHAGGLFKLKTGHVGLPQNLFAG